MRAETSERSGLKDGEAFRRYLQQELIRRCDANENYSLRAFALSLGVSHATLSSLLSGKRPLTHKAIIKLGAALKISSAQMDEFLLQRKSRLSSRARAARAHQQLALDVFSVVSDWYHDAILELTHTRNFKPDVRWIAKSLGLTTNEVLVAKERLERLDLLEVKEGRWIDLSKNNTTNLTNDLTSAALRKLQQSTLDKSLLALRDLPRTERDHTSLTVAMQRSDLDEVKERIKEFRFELVSFIERKNAKPDSVFQFAFAAFPLTKDE